MAVRFAIHYIWGALRSWFIVSRGGERALSVARQKPAPLRFRFALVTNGGQTSPLKSPAIPNTQEERVAVA